ncbi:MAG TPA: phosphopantetheine-binding protein [Thermoanaerobaculia bacterium]|nr:phosphopantetheine-binding protein [Thermoanaerobaculia bacterium]
MTDVAATVREIVAAHAPSKAVGDATPLGGDGAGLDSIALAEVLLGCEQRFGVEVASLLGHDALTIERLARHIDAQLVARATT